MTITFPGTKSRDLVIEEISSDDSVETIEDLISQTPAFKSYYSPDVAQYDQVPLLNLTTTVPNVVLIRGSAVQGTLNVGNFLPSLSLRPWDLSNQQGHCRYRLDGLQQAPESPISTR